MTQHQRRTTSENICSSPFDFFSAALPRAPKRKKKNNLDCIKISSKKNGGVRLDGLRGEHEHLGVLVEQNVEGEVADALVSVVV